jgi:hypothetical protein
VGAAAHGAASAGASHARAAAHAIQARGASARLPERGCGVRACRGQPHLQLAQVRLYPIERLLMAGIVAVEPALAAAHGCGASQRVSASARPTSPLRGAARAQWTAAQPCALGTLAPLIPLLLQWMPVKVATYAFDAASSPKRAAGS